MDDKSILRDLATRRKIVAKCKLDDAATDHTIASAIDFCFSELPLACHLEVLTLLVAIFRQISLLFGDGPSDTLCNIVHNKIVPTMQPGGNLASTLISDLGNPIKPIHQRAVDVLSGAAKLASVLPPPVTSTSSLQYFMGPLLLETIKSGTSTKTNLSLISAVLEYAPAEITPSTLLQDILGDMSSIECPGLRGMISVTLFSNRKKLSILGGDDERNEEMIAPLIPFLNPESNDPATLTQVTRYVLPNLFRQHPTALKTLLRMLDSTTTSGPKAVAPVDHLAAWIAVASLGVSAGLLDISDLSEKSLGDAIVHDDAEIRLRTFELVTSCKDLLRSDVVTLIKECLKWNEVLPSSESRTDFASAAHTYFTRLRAAEQTAIRQAKKLSTVSPMTGEWSHELHRSFLEDYVDPALRSVHRGTIVRVIMGLTLFKLYLEIFGSTHSTIPVVTMERMQWLLSCQSSAYAEVRSRARQVIEIAPSPLPGYESIEIPSVQLLLQSAYASLGHRRNTQAEAGKATLCIVFDKLVRSVDCPDQSTSLAFIDQLITKLEYNVAESERNLVIGIAKYPLHGLLAALRDVISYVKLDGTEAQILWRPTFHRIISIVDRVWGITRPVISLTAADPDAEDSVDSTSKGAEHEIARAIDVLGDADDGEEGEESDHTNLLSNSWRATKETGELLSVITTLPFKSSKSQQQQLWTKDDLAKAGDRFITWLHEIRHRGTFSKIAPAFADLISVLRQKTEYRGLCDTWLEGELKIIANDRISITRRSAAIPFSVLSIVSADQELLDKAIDRLVDAAKVDSMSSDTTKIHSFNTLKIILLDARQTRLFSRYFERVVMMALGAFTSANWNVRNVGLILFSTLVHRSLSTGRSQHASSSRTALASRQTFSAWNDKFPRILPSVIEVLHGIQREQTGNVGYSSAHSPLFPVLIIVRSLRWSAQGKEIQDRLKDAVSPFLSSVEWQVREVAAQSVSSLSSPQEASQRSCILLKTIVDFDGSDNAKHGDLLLLRRLFSDVINWTEVEPSTVSQLEDGLISTIGSNMSDSLVLVKATMDCLLAFLVQCPTVSERLRDSALTAATTQLQRSVSQIQPGSDLVNDTIAKILLILSPATPISSLLHSHQEDVVLAVLDAIKDDILDSQTLKAVLELAVCQKAGEATQTAALQVIDEAAPQILPPSLDDSMETFRYGLTCFIRSRNVPLREAALPALAWATAVDKTNIEQTQLAALAGLIETASREEQSEPSRSSSLRALTHLTSLLFTLTEHTIPSSTGLQLHQSLLRLLQDDDEDIRRGAAAIVVNGLSPDASEGARPVVQAKAVEMWWDWLNNSLHHYIGEEWVAWLWDLTMNTRENEDEALAVISKSPDSDVEILFEVENPNLYRDPLIDATYSAATLSQLKRDSGRVTDIGRQELFEARQDLISSAVGAAHPFSPIHSSWDAMKTLEATLVVFRGFKRSA